MASSHGTQPPNGSFLSKGFRRNPSGHCVQYCFNFQDAKRIAFNILVAEGEVNTGAEQSPRRTRGDYSPIFTRESVIAGVYFSQTSVIYFCPEFICCPYYQGVRYSGVSARRELTVNCVTCKREILSTYLDSLTPNLQHLLFFEEQHFL